MLILPLTAVFVFVVVVFFVVYRPTVVVGPSMLPTLRPGDRLLVTRGYGDPRRGDVVVFTETDRGATSEVVKRVVALPDDEVLAVGDRVWVNGEPETARRPVVTGAAADRVGPLTVPPGTVYVLGDNRPQSLDSRSEGPVPLLAVEGRVVAIFAPVSRVRRIDRAFAAP